MDSELALRLDRLADEAGMGQLQCKRGSSIHLTLEVQEVVGSSEEKCQAAEPPTL